MNNKKRLFSLACLTLVIYILTSANALADKQKIIILGDDVSAGYGVGAHETWVYLLRKKLYENRVPFEAFNESINGETTAGGLRRLPRLLTTYKPALVIIELGLNDALRRSNIEPIFKNLDQLIRMSLSAKANVMLVGAHIPTSVGGEDYGRTFQQIYGQLANHYRIMQLPSLLDGVTTNTKSGRNRIRTTAATQSVIFNNVWRTLGPWIEDRTSL